MCTSSCSPSSRGHRIAERDHLPELPGRVDVQQRERRLGRDRTPSSPGAASPSCPCRWNTASPAARTRRRPRAGCGCSRLRAVAGGSVGSSLSVESRVRSPAMRFHAGLVAERDCASAQRSSAYRALVARARAPEHKRSRPSALAENYTEFQIHKLHWHDTSLPLRGRTSIMARYFPRSHAASTACLGVTIVSPCPVTVALRSSPGRATLCRRAPSVRTIGRRSRVTPDEWHALPPDRRCASSRRTRRRSRPGGRRSTIRP